MMGIPAEECSVKGSLVFLLIFISHLQFEEIQKYLLTLTNGPEVVGMAWVMLIHDGNICQRIPGQMFFGFFTNIHLPPSGMQEIYKYLLSLTT
jgi:hypothetical protein